MSAVAEQKQLIKGGAFLIEERSPEEIFTPEDSAYYYEFDGGEDFLEEYFPDMMRDDR